MPPRWKCSGCRRKLSLTSGTLFHSRKLPVRDYLAVIALFVNGVKGTSALQISRDLNINPKISFVLLHKPREAMGSQVQNPDELELEGLSGAMVTSERELRRRMISELVAGAAVVLALVLTLALRWAGWG